MVAKRRLAFQLQQSDVNIDGHAEQPSGDAFEDAGPQVTGRRQRRPQVQSQLLTFTHAREGYVVRVIHPVAIHTNNIRRWSVFHML